MKYILIILLLTPIVANSQSTDQYAVKRIEGNTLQGERFGKNYIEFFSRTGTIRGRDEDGPYEARWELRGERLCISRGFGYDCARVTIENTDQVTLRYDTRQEKSKLIFGNPRRI